MQRTGRAVRRLVGLFVAGLCTLLILLDLVHEWYSREAALRSTVQSIRNLAESLAQHATDTIEMANATVAGVAARLETDGTSPVALNRLIPALRSQLVSTPRFNHIFIFGNDGALLATSRSDQAAVQNASDRAYFAHHRANADSTVYVGDPIRSRAEGEWILPISRRFNDVDGAFAGVVLVTVEARYFAEFYERFNVGEQGAIALITQDATIVSRMPWSELYVGENVAAIGIRDEAKLQGEVGSIDYDSPLDGVFRIGGYARAHRQPLTVVVAMSRVEALAEWRGQALVRGLAVLLLTAALAALGLRLIRQLELRRATERALSEREAAFRLLAEGSNDMIMRISPDGSRSYVSPASLRLLGFPPDTIVGGSAFSMVHPDDRPSVDAALTQLREHGADAVTVSFRARHRDGRVVWLEAALRMVRDPVSGVGGDIISTSRDITDRKLLEEKLEELATTDTLTGLRNRRAFDDNLSLEWRRSARAGSPLSLLLIDVDRFKLFNDTYGHPKGDACLAAVAGAIAEAVRRPGDSAARYGGEEMAVILPDTPTIGAVAMANRIRTAVHDLAIPHAANPPHDIITVSIGISTLRPTVEPSQVSAEDLVETADAALYRAKRAGRDRTEVAAIELNMNLDAAAVPPGRPLSA